uniref:Uncharacterized protein n=1 Tax=Anguilla anguilla TaxID=7936 RepID=A0A0E9R3T8_ANGAN
MYFSTIQAILQCLTQDTQYLVQKLTLEFTVSVFDLGERALENLCCRPSNLILRLHQIGQQTQTLGDAGVAKRPTHAWRLVTVTSGFKIFFKTINSVVRSITCPWLLEDGSCCKGA